LVKRPNHVQAGESSGSSTYPEPFPIRDGGSGQIAMPWTSPRGEQRPVIPDTGVTRTIPTNRPRRKRPDRRPKRLLPNRRFLAPRPGLEPGTYGSPSPTPTPDPHRTRARTWAVFAGVPWVRRKNGPPWVGPGPSRTSIRSPVGGRPQVAKVGNAWGQGGRNREAAHRSPAVPSCFPLRTPAP